jgi:hypothetical protein
MTVLERGSINFRKKLHRKIQNSTGALSRQTIFHKLKVVVFWRGHDWKNDETKAL